MIYYWAGKADKKAILFHERMACHLCERIAGVKSDDWIPSAVGERITRGLIVMENAVSEYRNRMKTFRFICWFSMKNVFYQL